MMPRLSLIGFGEAARTFVQGGLRASSAYDVDPAKRDGLASHVSLDRALEQASVVLSLVTADQALAAAQSAAPHLVAGALYFDMNSVAPDTKRAAARAIEAAGGRYVDVAVMAPVDPAGLAVPLLLSGPHADEGAEVLRRLGFTNVRVLPGDVGRASSVKMIRSVMIKGIEALTAEMMAAADAAGVADEVLASLGTDWPSKVAYNLERMATHGVRRAAEMEESAKTLTALGVDPVMTRGTVIRQREMATTLLKEAA
jgi:3-hydroxyisobutyrate dehydrogenase-like beta-hydroxyacid dehydrogenase